MMQLCIFVTTFYGNKSMALLKPYFNSNGSGKKNVTNTSAHRKAKEEHEAYLRSMGVHPEQLKGKKHRGVVSVPKYVSDGIKTSDTIVPGGQVKGIMANLHNEPEHIKRAILEKASRCTTLYNKGAYGLPVESDGNILGSMSRRM